MLELSSGAGDVSHAPKIEGLTYMEGEVSGEDLVMEVDVTIETEVDHHAIDMSETTGAQRSNLMLSNLA